MAFSTFRGMMAGNTHGTPPVSIAGVYPRTAAIIGSLSGGTNGSSSTDYTILPSSTSRFFTAYLHTSGNTLYGCMMNTSTTGYVTTGTPLLIDTTSGSVNVTSDAVSTTSFLVAYQSQPSTIYSLLLANVTSSGSTLSLNTGPTAFYSNQVNGVVGCCVLNSTNALVLGGTSSAQNMDLIDPSALTSYSTQSLTLSMSVGAPELNRMLGMSSTLGSLLYIDGSGVLKYVGIDVVAGTSFTVHTPTTIATPANASNNFSCAKITSTTILVAYGKNSTTIGVRVLTVGSGGSCSIGTEYTFVTGSTSQNTQYQCAVLSSTLAVLSILPLAKVGTYAIPIQISGTAITFGSVYPNVTSSSFASRASLAPMSSTAAAMMYSVSAGNFPSPVTSSECYASVLDYNAANPTWNSTYAGNNVVGGSTQLASVNNFTESLTYLGSNRALVNWNSSGSTVGWSCFQLDTNASNIIASSTSATVTGLSTAYTSGQCRTFDDTTSTTRACAFYFDASNNVQFAVVSVASDGTVTLGTTNTGFTSVSSSNNLIVNVTTNKSLYIQGNSSRTLQAALVTTSGTTVSTISALTTLVTATGTAGCIVIAGQSVDSNTVIVVYSHDNGFAKAGLWAALIDISSGTPSLIGKTLLTPTSIASSGPWAVGFTVGNNRAVALYNNASTLYGIGFSYTNSTVTVGSAPVNLGTSAAYSFGQPSQGFVGVSATEVLVVAQNTSTDSRWYTSIVTTPDINTLSMGSQFVLTGIANTGGGLTFAATENQNAVAFNSWGGTNPYYAQAGYIFRG